jgi:hypothetical protein
LTHNWYLLENPLIVWLVPELAFTVFIAGNESLRVTKERPMKEKTKP